MKRVTEFTSVGYERVKILVNYCSRKMDRIRMRSRKSCTVRPWKGWRHAVTKFRRAVSMKTAVEKRYKCNMASVT